MAKTLKPLIEEYLAGAKLMQMATSRGNRPWIASVWYAHDSKTNLYFISKKSRRHSKELMKNPRVAGAIVVPHTFGSGQKVRGLQFEGMAEPCSARETVAARSLYLKKYPNAEKISLADLLSPLSKSSFYIMRPKAFVLFDEIHYPEQPRQEFPAQREK